VSSTATVSTWHDMAWCDEQSAFTSLRPAPAPTRPMCVCVYVDSCVCVCACSVCQGGSEGGREGGRERFIRSKVPKQSDALDAPASIPSRSSQAPARNAARVSGQAKKGEREKEKGGAEKASFQEGKPSPLYSLPCQIPDLRGHTGPCWHHTDDNMADANTKPRQVSSVSLSVRL
jgi:hypothetical protein